MTILGVVNTIKENERWQSLNIIERYLIKGHVD